MIHKVQAFIFRFKNNKAQALVFEHDLTKIHQMIRGTVEDLEDLETAVLREVAEESGLKNLKLHEKFGEQLLQVRSGPTRSGPFQDQMHHAFLLECQKDTEDKWTHLAEGSVEENGLKFHFYWAELNDSLIEIVFDDFKVFIPKFIARVKTLSDSCLL
ncbi:MAG: NUDIX domain-containing protein [Candidatus Cloacimonetes bacterium]|nr:NUDIX domain-containing protein [Candidatus Cloacimonadota bacterium]